MKKTLLMMAVALTLGFVACKKADFADSYADPSKISETTVEKQFAGFMVTNREYVLPSYWNYFVVLRTTINRYTQAVGWVNSTAQYVPGAAGITDRWGNYYSLLAQYRELQKVYSKLSAADQKEKRIYMITAAIYLYDATQKVVDLHGDIPFSEAGMLSANSGDYTKSLPKYDTPETVYTKMLDDLKAFAVELNSITVSAGIAIGFKNQDIVNNGDITAWKKYCNSLRLRMLTRVSGVTTFQSRYTSETADILGSAATYPVVADNTSNIQIDVTNLNSNINSSGFRSGLEDWSGNVAGKAIIDHMNTNADPRLRAIFQPGASAVAGAYVGLNPSLTSTAQDLLVSGGTLALYNWSTLTRNQYFPGVLINAAEVNFLACESYLKAGNAASAKTAYNAGISNSIKFYYLVRTLSNDNASGALTATTDAEIAAYSAKTAISWDLALTQADKLNLIATQKWIHFNVVQPEENWAEIRRFDAPTLTFWSDAANAQTLPPVRWFYAASEKTYNTVNYNAVTAKDKLTTKIFWDIK